MAARAIWKGFLRIALVNVPVRLYTSAASGEGGGIRLNQLHDNCGVRIKHVKTCPLHGEVRSEEIVSGYEFAKDQYVVIDPDELDQLRTESDKAISVSTFV
jgi:DNA end-binding protein Ku